jgi:hypothetical protein
MFEPGAYLQAMQSRGFSFRTDGVGLVCCPVHRLTDDDRAVIGEHRAAIVAELEANPVGRCQTFETGDEVQVWTGSAWTPAAVVRVWTDTEDTPTVPERVGWVEVNTGRPYNETFPPESVRKPGD